MKKGPIISLVAYASGEKVIIKVGSGEGIEVGMFFAVQRIVGEVKDPDTE